MSQQPLSEAETAVLNNFIATGLFTRLAIAIENKKKELSFDDSIEKTSLIASYNKGLDQSVESFRELMKTPQTKETKPLRAPALNHNAGKPKAAKAKSKQAKPE